MYSSGKSRLEVSCDKQRCAGLRMHATLCVLSCSVSRRVNNLEDRRLLLFEWQSRTYHPVIPPYDSATLALDRFDHSEI
jgi:hypothetical protein